MELLARKVSFVGNALNSIVSVSVGITDKDDQSEEKRGIEDKIEGKYGET